MVFGAGLPVLVRQPVVEVSKFCPSVFAVLVDAHLDPAVSVTWEAPRMRYRLGGVPVMISEGVTCSSLVQRQASQTRLVN